MTRGNGTVVHVETGPRLYGGALQAVYLMRGLRARGWSNVLVCSRGSAIAKEAEDCADPIRAIPVSGDLDLRLYGRLRAIFRETRPSLVHLHSRRGADLLGGLAARGHRLPVVLSRRVDNPEARWWASRKYRLYDAVVTISRGIRDVLVAEGVPESLIRCVPSAVDTVRFRPGGDRVWLESEFGLGPGDLAVGTIAQFIPRKGHRHLLDAVPSVLDRVPNARFLLFGRGPLEPRVADRIERDGLAGVVRVAGFRDDLERVIPALDLVVHPAEMEGLGVALLQAAACAVPIVATPVGGIPEIVRDGLNGRLVEPGRTGALAAAIAELLESRERAGTMGRAGRDLVERSFSIDAMVEGNLAVYREVLARRRATIAGGDFP